MAITLPAVPTTSAAPTASKGSTLYHLTLETQTIDGELALALEKAGSDDPEEQAEAEALIQGLLRRASATSELVQQKANAICHVREALLGKAAFLRQAAAERLAKAEAEERAAQRLSDSLIRCLTTLNPGQKKFPLPEYTISSRTTTSVDVDTVNAIPPQYLRHEIKIRLQPEGHDSLGALLQAINAATATAPDGTCDVALTSSPSKTALKDALKSGEQIDGARLQTNQHWTIK